MSEARNNKTVSLGLALLTLLALSRPSRGGDWHSGATLNCSDCHTMHNSASGQPMRYDGQSQPAPKLLRNATSLSLCLHCHDGNMPGSPDVWAPVAGETPGGAFPNVPLGTATGTAHTLGGDPVTPPGGTATMALTCVSCHDPHGSANYRNLKTDPLGDGVTLSVTARQNVTADGTNAAQVYTQSNVIHKSGASRWCASCHGPLENNSHPVDRTIFGSPFADYTSWSGAVTNRVPAQSPNDDVIPSQDDQVTCLSCHKAHGSPNSAALIFADGQTVDSTCQQCHNQ